METVKITAGYLKDILERVPPESDVFVNIERNDWVCDATSVNIVHFVDKESGEVKQRIEINGNDQ